MISSPQKQPKLLSTGCFNHIFNYTLTQRVEKAARRVKNGLLKSILVTDRHSSYFNMNVADHQICLAHILRELTFLTELDTKQTWSSELADLIWETIYKRKTVLWENIDRNSILDKLSLLQKVRVESLF
ncbi:MAG: transposase [Paludibacter sp.]